MQVFKYGDNVDTDVIIPARYLQIADMSELARHCMEDIDSSFVSKVKPGDVIVGGHNFGSGSSREHAPMVIKECGIACVIAQSFARIFYRNCFNIGLPVLECEEAGEISSSDELKIDFKAGIIFNITTGKEYHAQILPDFINELIKVGGLVEYTKGVMKCTK